MSPRRSAWLLFFAVLLTFSHLAVARAVLRRDNWSLCNRLHRDCKRLHGVRGSEGPCFGCLFAPGSVQRLAQVAARTN